LADPVIPVSTARLSMGGRCGFCAVFKDRREACTPACGWVLRARRLRDCPTAGGRRSLKTQQHAGLVCGLRVASHPSSQEAGGRWSGRPGSVDVLGPTARHRQIVPALSRRRAPDGRCDRGTIGAP
jgi:hypothetical protein